MNNYVIITDSSADLSAEMAGRYGIRVLPLSVTIEDKTFYNYVDNREIAPKTFYDMMRGGALATTAAVNVEQYQAALEEYLSAGLDVLVLSFSSGLSNTYNASRIAVEEMQSKYPERQVYTVDTLCASMGQGLIVYLAAREKEKGKTIQEVRDWVENNKMSVCHWLTVDDLMFLKRGGRISATTAVMGSMFQIKPIIHVDDEGHLMNMGKARGRQAALKMLVDKMEETGFCTGTETVFISHGDCLEDAEATAKMVRERFGIQDIHINFVGPVIGAHTGPGIVALFFLGKER